MEYAQDWLFFSVRCPTILLIISEDIKWLFKQDEILSSCLLLFPLLLLFVTITTHLHSAIHPHYRKQRLQREMVSHHNQILTEQDLMEKISALEATLRTCSPDRMQDPCFSYPGSRPRKPSNSDIETLQIWIAAASYVDYYTKVSHRLNGLKALYEGERLRAIRETERLQAQRQSQWPFNSQGPYRNPVSTSPIGKPHLLSGRTKGSSVHDFRPHKQRVGGSPVLSTPHTPPSFRAKSNLSGPWAGPSSSGVERHSPSDSSGTGNSSQGTYTTNGGHGSTNGEGGSSEAELNQLSGQHHCGSDIDSHLSAGTELQHPATSEYLPLGMPATPIPDLGTTAFLQPVYLSPTLDPNMTMSALAENWHTSRGSPSNAAHSPMDYSLYAGVMDGSMPTYVPSSYAPSTSTAAPSLSNGYFELQPSPLTTEDIESAFDSDEEYDF